LKNGRWDDRAEMPQDPQAGNAAKGMNPRSAAGQKRLSGQAVRKRRMRVRYVTPRRAFDE